jgi:hypothetical protein
MTTFKELTTGTVINYTNNIVADDIDFVVLKQYSDKFGNFTLLLNKQTNELESITSHTIISVRWSIVKIN